MSRLKPWRDYFENILVAIFLALIVRTFVLAGYKVPTASMAPNLKPGDFIFAYKLPFGFKLPFVKNKISIPNARRGDIVVFTYPEQPRTNYVKRIVGLPGDLIKIVDDTLIVNGKVFKYQELDHKLIDDLPGSEAQMVMAEEATEGQRIIILSKQKKKKTFGPIIIPPDEVFLLGDNRDASDDSRYWGTVPLTRIEARVVLIWFSLDWQQYLGEWVPSLRWQRMFTRPR